MSSSPAKKKATSKKSPPKDSKQKYDWPLEKLAFFSSDYSEVKSFFENKYSTYTEQIKKKTAGWTKEKKEWRAQITKEAIEKMGEEQVQRTKTMLSKARLAVERNLDSVLEGTCERTDDIKKLWEITRTENDLPVRINENNNYNRDVVSDEDALDQLDDEINQYETSQKKQGSKAVQKSKAKSKPKPSPKGNTP